MRIALRLTRAAVTFVLAFALGVMPVATDWCAASCEAAHPASASASDPICHHASTTATIGGIPVRCGHDHAGSPGITAADFARRSPSSISAIAVGRPTLTGIQVVRTQHAEQVLGPPIDSVPLALSSSLRI